MNSEKMSNLAAVYLLPYTILVFSALPVISYICILHKSIKYSAKFCFKAVKSFKVLIRKKKNMSIYYFIVIIPVALDFFLYLSCHLVSLPFSLKNFLQHFWSTVLLVTTFYLKMPLFCLHFWSTVALHIEFLVSIFFFFLPSALQIYYSNVFCSHSFLMGSQPLLTAIPVYAIFLLQFSCLRFITGCQCCQDVSKSDFLCACPTWGLLRFLDLLIFSTKV